MKQPTEKQTRARRGRACMLTSERHGCGEAPKTQIEGIEVQMCAHHLRLLFSIVRQAKEEKLGRHPRRVRTA